MRVLFVYSDISGEYYGAKKFYSGIASLSAVLKQSGHETDLIYLQREASAEEFLAEVVAQDPALVAFSSTTHQFPYIERYAGFLRDARPDLMRVVGGVHATLVPEEVVSHPAFDAICVGEGEYPLRELAERLEQGQDWTNVQNIWFERDGQVVRNPMRPLVEDLDELPFADRELFGYDAILAANDGWVDIMTARGCPYNCSYCCNPGLKSRYRGLGRYVRYRGIEHVMAELRLLRERYAVKTINFQDDTFTLDPKWTLAFCEAYAAEFDYPFWINTRVERIQDENVVASLARAGCEGIRVGVESGDAELRAKVLGRMMSNQEIIDAFDLVHSHGIKAYTTNMIGIPGETLDMIKATIDLNRRLMPEQFQFSVFYPFPMTALYDQCVEQGLLQPDREVSTYYARESVLDLPTLSPVELAHGYDLFDALHAELALKRSSPTKHRIYMALLKLFGGDAVRLQKVLGSIRTLRSRLSSLLRGGKR